MTDNNLDIEREFVFFFFFFEIKCFFVFNVIFHAPNILLMV